MIFSKPLSGGLLIVGSLIWDKHETRVTLREQYLDIKAVKIVPAPIRYGRKSAKRQTITMVLSTSCKSADKIGTGAMLPFVKLIGNTNYLCKVAKAIIDAENKKEVDFLGFNWGWGCLSLLPNRNKLKYDNVMQLIQFWATKYGGGFNPNEYIIEGEQQLITKQGKLLLDWKDEYADLDFIVITATKPNIPIPSSKELAQSAENDKSYFEENKNHGINTFQDEAMLQILNYTHEEKP